ncbi:MAG: DNA methyltransferase [Prevotella sp.]|nr:DNA methyltransferase [Prevotella sp.]
MDVKEYIAAIGRKYAQGNATEHSYRGCLEQLLQEMLPQMAVTNEPKRVRCGAPDYIITRTDGQPVCYIEAKDIGDADLDGRNPHLHREQFDRYKASLGRVIFTDYLDFHFYANGQWVENIRIGEVQGDKVVPLKGNAGRFQSAIKRFAQADPQPVTTAAQLASLMAAKARLLAAIIDRALADDEENYDNDNLQGQYEAFRDVLIHELSTADFADIYAQTIAYGMFAARLHDPTPEDFSRQEAATLIPKTNPFLRQIFNNIAGSDLDGRITWVVEDLVGIFRTADVAEIMQRYGKDRLHHDPMIHFYEDFLSQYDPRLRRAKGVWYTPQPVVSFIVRAVDGMLQREFGLDEGLADCSMVETQVSIEQTRDRRTADRMRHAKRLFHRVQILDPATGTGTFLAEVVNQVYDRYRDQQGIWQQYVEKHLLPRLNGFEILMASYAVAHLKLDMLLQETGYRHAENANRLRIYLTNSLEECNREPRTLFARWLSNEANEANVIKRDKPVMVMIGNPPYNGASANKGEWIMKLMSDYKKEPGGKQPLDERNPKWLNDDYVKFIRLAQDYIERNGEGVIGFINPHGFLDNPTFRGMRWNLLKTFDQIYTIDLHGNSKKRETCPDGSKDENVFDIMQGVSINLFVKTGRKEKEQLGRVYHADLYGTREHKYECLDQATIESIPYKEIKPKAPMYFFVPKDFELEEEYNKGFKVDELFNVCLLGPNSHRDDFAIAFTQEEAAARIADFTNTSISDYEIRAKYQLKDTRDWNIHDARELTNGTEIPVKCLYRAFDFRYMLYGKYAFDYHRPQLNDQLLNDNFALIVNRQNRLSFSTFVTKIPLGQHCILDPREGSYAMPLYFYNEDNGELFKNDSSSKRTLHLNPTILRTIEEGLSLEKDCFTNNPLESQSLFDYIYAVLHSPSYRKRYEEFLKIDFPRIPYPTDLGEFRRLADIGAQLRRLHLMEGLPTRTGITFPVAGTNVVDRCQWEGGRVYINATQYFDGVTEEAFQHYIGGYQPAQKWLKDRRGRTLDFDDVRHYERIIYALDATRRLMSLI